MNMNFWKYFLSFFCGVGSCYFIFFFFVEKESVEEVKDSVTLSQEGEGFSQETESLFDIDKIEEFKLEETSQSLQVSRKSSFYETLFKEKISPQTILDITKAAKHQFDLSRIAPGTKLILSWNAEELKKLKIYLSDTEELHIFAENSGSWKSNLLKHEIQIENVAFFGSIASTLWESANSSGMPTELIASLAEIYASQIDFTRELDKGDEWGVLVEKQMVEGKPIGYGNILVAEITKRGESLKAFRFKVNGREKYFDEHGTNVIGKFLKTPLKYSRVSSRFNKARFHPILKKRRPHLGVDFAAPTGTPIRSVGDGDVIFAGRNGGAGIMIKIRHDKRYKTAYKHLSKLRKGMRKGKKVSQGEIIGYVGSTGYATGPHLHFEFLKDGKFVDPLGKRFPRKESIPSKYKKDFLAKAKEMESIFSTQRKNARST